jgi:hypothetical protein
MKKNINFNDNSKKRTLVYSKQKDFKHKPQFLISEGLRTTPQTPTDFKNQSVKLHKEYLKPEYTEIESESYLKLQNYKLSQENQALLSQITMQKKTIEILCNHNKELVDTLIDTIYSLIDLQNFENPFKKKLILEIKTSLVSKLESFSSDELDYKKQIEIVSLWGMKAKKSALSKENEVLHPLNPLKSILKVQKAKAIFDFKAEIVSFI